tara:strand:+ start:6936 stop:7178 length:243 start_codon:yes stop_codon:yes gene_type:complete
MAYIYAALMKQVLKQVLDISKLERKSDVHQYGELQDLGRRFEVAEGVFAHLPRLNAPAPRLKAYALTNPTKSFDTDSLHF